jgi:hypothetical protein
MNHAVDYDTGLMKIVVKLKSFNLMSSSLRQLFEPTCLLGVLYNFLINEEQK